MEKWETGKREAHRKRRGIKREGDIEKGTDSEREGAERG